MAKDGSAPTPEQALEALRSELDYEILEMRRVLKVGGCAVWRSAAKRPWYRQRWVRHRMILVTMRDVEHQVGYALIRSRFEVAGFRGELDGAVGHGCGADGLLS
jgi:hypothetical protein